MFAGHTAKFWDDRYSESGYAFGTAPNQFLTAQHQHLKPGMKTLVIGDGHWVRKKPSPSGTASG
jgi:hypothetical protein